MIMDFCEKYGDPRLKDYFLMESPMSTVFMVALYLIIVKMLGPKLMENREEFDLRKTLLIYNLCQVVLSLIIFYRCSTFWLFDYNWRCAPMNRERTPKQFYVINTTYLYFLSKFTEFFDTVFFVMRKKFRQISTLHVFHHSVMPLIAWIGLKVTPVGHGTLTIFLNSGVHVIMYSYYLLSGMGPEVQKYLWWKRYLTQIQIIQFFVGFLHWSQLYYHNPCKFPLFAFHLVGLIIGVTFFVMFAS
jgi:elongation of very long chain fatty acids protein 7